MSLSDSNEEDSGMSEDFVDHPNEGMGGRNGSPDPEAGGLSPALLSALRRHPWDSPESPLRLNPGLREKDVKGARAFTEARSFLRAVRDLGGFKPTSRGNVPRRIVGGMLDLFLDEKEKARFASIKKVFNEEDVLGLHVSRLVCELSGVLELRSGKFQVNPESLPLLQKNRAGELYQQLFKTYFTEYNIGYTFPFKATPDWIQEQVGHALYSLQNRCRDWVDFAELPGILLEPDIRARLAEELVDQDYLDELRVISHYLISPFQEWGLVEFEGDDEERRFMGRDVRRIRTTPLCHKFVQFQDPESFAS